MRDDRDPTVPVIYINGKRFELPLGRAEATLLEYLRGTNWKTWEP